MSALAKIKQAGFELTLIGDTFKIHPSTRLTETQRDFLKRNKIEIVNELRVERAVTDMLQKPIVEFYHNRLDVLINSFGFDEAEAIELAKQATWMLFPSWKPDNSTATEPE